MPRKARFAKAPSGAAISRREAATLLLYVVPSRLLSQTVSRCAGEDERWMRGSRRSPPCTRPKVRVRAAPASAPGFEGRHEGAKAQRRKKGLPLRGNIAHRAQAMGKTGVTGPQGRHDRFERRKRSGRSAGDRPLRWFEPCSPKLRTSGAGRRSDAGCRTRRCRPRRGGRASRRPRCPRPRRRDSRR